MSEKQKFCKLLDDAIKDEEMAPKVYEQLATLEEKGLAREVFITIAHQERDHKALLEKIKLNRCEIR